MYGVALEGGGLKGAYHIGVVKALYECGYDLGGFVGTSIGAFNAAVMAQGDFEKLYKTWWEGSSALALDVDTNELKKVSHKKIDIGSIKYWSNYFIEQISNKGIDSMKLETLYDSLLDEEKLKKSNLDYGMVTVSLTDKKPVYIYKEDIPDKMTTKYVLASSYLPVFKQDTLLKDNKTYIDGGFYDNCPISLLVDKGYTDIIEVRTNAIGMQRKINRKGLNIITIAASKDLGSILFGDNESVKKNIQMGYFDALRVLKGYIGSEYYVVPTDDVNIWNSLNNLTDEQILNIIKGIKIPHVTENMEPKKILFEHILPTIELRLKGMDTSTYQKAIVSMIEYMVDDKDLKVYSVYTFEEILMKFKKLIPKLLEAEKKALIKNITNELLLRLLKVWELK